MLAASPCDAHYQSRDGNGAHEALAASLCDAHIRLLGKYAES